MAGKGYSTIQVSLVQRNYKYFCMKNHLIGEDHVNIQRQLRVASPSQVASKIQNIFPLCTSQDEFSCILIKKINKRKEKLFSSLKRNISLSSLQNKICGIK